jgi:hypothetical protein
MTPPSKENGWLRSIIAKLENAGLGLFNFQVTLRIRPSLMNDLGTEGELISDQLGHSGLTP